MRLVRVEDAIGQVLGYDTTYVGRDGATVLLPRGHVITRDDVEKLKDSGVYFVWVEGNEESSDLMYEWEIAETVARAVAGENTYIKPARQGSAWIMSSVNGVLKVDIHGLTELNLGGNVLLITRQGMSGVVKDELVGIIDVIPLSMRRSEVEELLRYRNLISVVPFRRRKIGIVITGTEIYQGRKRDLYYPVIKARADKYGWEVTFNTVVPDDEDKIMNAVKEAISNGVEAIVITGGMSVDPTDKTPNAIRRLGARVIAYGVPIKPTTMTMIAMLDNTPILAISAGGIYYSDYNAIDIFLPRLMADLIPSREEIAAMGHGGILPNYRPHH
ncbi:molybdopterin-binding protein [Vulcanisaeta distributa]|uniref:Molybdopterin binding domain protein n=1 Tax=Vulcanisaeta distributa (strain DSM 14429 / JCM 11212 / NBRC 100878 / IC-017) TaxID=572478 RepID=E1QTY6_VULDI|nr:molybdopterin-binding protein [Vulcanisaeta distributa]ADN49783.1 molybdopterin binding domain protein [Vulcanisaeta distributa DSM 14429]